jgi:hypothetical protein
MLVLRALSAASNLSLEPNGARLGRVGSLYRGNGARVSSNDGGS